MALPVKIPVTPFLDSKTGKPTIPWQQFFLGLGNAVAATVANPVTSSGSTAAALPAAPVATAYVPQLSTPEFVALSPGAVVPKFRVRCFVPDILATQIDLYFQTVDQASSLQGAGWVHYGRVGSLNGSSFTPNAPVDVEVLNPPPTPSGQKYFAVYTITSSSGVSAPSGPSDGLQWPPTGQFLIDPVGPTLKAAMDGSGNVTKIRVSMNFAQPLNTLPDGLVVMYSMNDVPNQIKILAGGTGNDLSIDSVTIDAGGTGLILAGSTVAELVNTTLISPNNTNFPQISRYWVQYGQSSWRKATGITATSFLFDPPFDIAPTAGESTNWVEIAWFDDRGPDASDTFGVPGESYRLACLVSGSSFEVLSWTNVYEDSNQLFHVGGCVRGLEGTVPIAADGLTMHYYPAPGAGTVAIVIPAINFTASPSGTWSAEADANITLPAGWSMSGTCCTYKGVLGKMIRSNIVPLSYGGAF